MVRGAFRAMGRALRSGTTDEWMGFSGEGKEITRRWAGLCGAGFIGGGRDLEDGWWTCGAGLNDGSYYLGVAGSWTWLNFVGGNCGDQRINRAWSVIVRFLEAGIVWCWLYFPVTEFTHSA